MAVAAHPPAQPGRDPDPDPDSDVDRDAARDAVPRPAPAPTWADLVERARNRFGWEPRRVAGLAVVVLLAAGAAVAGAVFLRPHPLPPTEELLPLAGAAPGNPAPSAAPPTPVTPSTAGELVVHAAGAVAVPGVHRVPAGSRVADLLAAAGGASPDADIDRVNLAAALVDGQRVWFPRLGEPEPPLVVDPAGGAAGPEAGGGVPAGPVDLNTATAEQLDTLPGVGPATAAAIIEHRERNGPFRSVDALLDVPGIGDAKLAQLRDLVTT